MSVEKEKLRFPIGIYKYIPVEDEDPTAQKVEIDMRYFIEDINRGGFICKIDKVFYPKEMFRDYEIKNEGIIRVMKEEAKQHLGF